MNPNGCLHSVKVNYHNIVAKSKDKNFISSLSGKNNQNCVGKVQLLEETLTEIVKSLHNKLYNSIICSLAANSVTRPLMTRSEISHRPAVRKQFCKVMLPATGLFQTIFNFLYKIADGTNR